MEPSKANIQELLEKMRTVTVGAVVQLAKSTVEHGGIPFEIRQPTMAVRGNILKAANIKTKQTGPDGKETEVEVQDFNALIFNAAIQCTFVPESDQKVFSVTDIPRMLEDPAGIGGFVHKMGMAALDLMNIEGPKTGKDSGKTSSDSSSSPSPAK